MRGTSSPAITDMDFPCTCLFFRVLFVFGILGLGISAGQAAPPAPDSPSKSQAAATGAEKYPPNLVEQGAALFRQDCSFCHGRDATGGESGPDLTRSRLVASDVNGNRISSVVRNGRPERGMPPFDRSDQQIASLVAFIHTQQQKVAGA